MRLPCLLLLVLAAVGLAAGEPTRLVCTPDTHPALRIRGDRACRYPNGQVAAFRGHADPCLRRDPQTGHLWLAYSWPHMAHQGGGKTDFAVGVETHLARSTDGGKTWQHVADLWPRTPANHRDHRTGKRRDGFVSHEVPNIVPCRIDGEPAWVGIRCDYFLGYPGNYQDRDDRSFTLRLTVAATPPELATARPITFGHRLTSPEMRPDHNLCDFSPDFPAAFIPNEPALHWDGERLYLLFVCMTFRATNQPDFAKSFIPVFSTVPGGPTRTWRWQYHGKLAGRREARELGGEALTQIELAAGRDGQLLAFVTPESWHPEAAREAGGDAFFGIRHHGCYGLEVADLRQPALARDATGKLRVRAIVSGSPASPLGPGAAAYDPASATGLIVCDRRIAPRRVMVWSLHPTKLHP